MKNVSKVPRPRAIFALTAASLLASCDALGKSIGQLAAEGDVSACAAPAVVAVVADRMLTGSDVTTATEGVTVNARGAYISKGEPAEKRVQCIATIAVSYQGVTKEAEGHFVVAQAAGGDQDWTILYDTMWGVRGAIGPFGTRQSQVEPAAKSAENGLVSMQDPEMAGARITDPQAYEDELEAGRRRMFAGVQPDEPIVLDPNDAEAVRAAIAEWQGYANICTDERNPEAETNCTYSVIMHHRLRDAGFCNGRHDQDPSVWTWHRCGPGSVQ